MSAIWYACIQGQQRGPLTELQLIELVQAGKIEAGTLVWTQGMAGWETCAKSAVAHVLDARVALAAPEETELSPYAPPRSSFVAPVPAASVSRYGPYQDPSGLTRILRGFLIAYVAICVAALVSAGLQTQLLTAHQDGAFPSEAEYQAKSDMNDLRQGVIGLSYFLVYVGCVITWCLWTNRVSKNAWSFGAQWLTISPGWAVGWYFVPVAMIWKPFQALSQAWRASVDPVQGGSARAPALLGWWWGLWLASNFVANISFRLSISGDSAETLVMSTWMSVVEQLVSIPSGIVALQMVTRLGKLQIERVQGAK